MNKTYFITNDMSLEDRLDAMVFYTWLWAALKVNVKWTPVKNNLYNEDSL